MRDDLIFLNSKISGCKRCTLFSNGRALPFIGENIKAVLFGEAPGEEEVLKGEPFVGRAGKLLMTSLLRFGFTRNDFLILNSCNCRPVDNGKNGKPTIEQLTACYPINEVYFKYSGVRHIMVLGSYPKWYFTQELGGITNYVGQTTEYRDKKVWFNFHPAACLYNPKNIDSFLAVMEAFCSEINADINNR